MVAVGEVLPAREFTLTRADLVRYAGASGDFNPIHWNQRLATEVGLPDVIAHGMLTMGLAIRVVTDWLGDPGALLSYGVRFTKPVVVPDPGQAVLAVTGKVRAVDEQAGTAELELTVTVEGEKVLLRARAMARVGAGPTLGSALGQPGAVR